MKKILVLATCMLLLLAGAAQAAGLYLGGQYNTISSVVNGSPQNEGGGSIDPSTWNGTPLTYVYCVDLFKTINAGANYPLATARNDGWVNDGFVNRFGQIAWLLDNYGTAALGDTNKESALQGAIWHLLYDGTSNSYEVASTSLAFATYQSMLTDLSSNGSPDGNVSAYLWITPGGPNNLRLQGLVAPNPVPEPGTMILLGSGLVGLAGWGRKKFRK